MEGTSLNQSDEDFLIIAQIWSSVLKIQTEVIKLSDTFFSLGGTRAEFKSLLRAYRSHSFLSNEKVFRQLSQPEASLESLLKTFKAIKSEYNQLVRRVDFDDETTPFPLSYQQEQVWYHIQHSPNPSLCTSYHETTKYYFKFKFHPEIFTSTIKSIVQKYSIFRTTILEINRVPHNVLRQYDNIPIQIIKPKDENELQGILEDSVKIPFDLETGPLFKYLVYEVDDTLTIVYAIYHHLIMDGLVLKMIELIVQETYDKIMNAVDTEDDFQNSKLLRYSDYVHWQRNFEIQSSITKAGVKYWVEQFENTSTNEQLKIITDYSRKTKESIGCRGNRIQFQFSNNVISNLNKFIHQNSTTLFNVLIAAFNILLFKLSGQSEIVLFSITHGRGFTDLHSILGFCANSFLIKTKVNDKITFSETVKNVSKYMSEASMYVNNVPFQKIVQELRKLNFELPNIGICMMYPRNRLNSGNFFEVYSNPIDQCKYELLFLIDPFLVDQSPNGEVNLFFEYNADHYSVEKIERMTKSLELIIEQGISASTHTPSIESLSIISPSEHDLISQYSNINNYKEIKNLRKITEYFKDQVNLTPTAPAVIEGDIILTYNDLWDQCYSIACHLNYLKQGNGTKFIITLMSNGIQYLIISAAALLADLTVVPIGVTTPKKLVLKTLNDIDNSMIISSQDILDELKIDESNQIVTFDKIMEVVSNTNEKIDIQESNSFSTPPYIIHTSGSTGSPKAVLFTHSTVIHTCLWVRNEMKLTPADRTLLFTSPTFDISLFEIWPTLTSGGCLFVPPHDLRHNIPQLRKWSKGQGISYIVMCTPIAELFYDRCNTEDVGENLRIILTAGEKRKTKPPSGSKYKLYDLYGPMETCVSSWTCVDPEDQVHHIGKPFPHDFIQICDKNLQVVPIGVEGELCLGGASLNIGYYGNPELTNEKFVIDPRSSKRMYKSGDVGYWNNDGNIVIVGRNDNQVKCRGYRIELNGIERILLDYPLIASAVVIHSEGKLYAFITWKHKKGSTKEVQAHLKQNLPSPLLPNKIIALRELPLNNNGKVDRNQLLDRAENNFYIDVATNDHKSPISEAEISIGNIWSKVLNIPTESMDINLTFFELGGNSLIIGEVTTQIGDIFGVQLSIAEFFQNPTITKLANHIELVKSGKIQNEHFDLAKELEADFSHLNFSNQMEKGKILRNCPTILLTGVTGYLGSHLLIELLELLPNSKIYTIIRSNSDADAEQRLLRTLKKYSMKFDHRFLGARVIPLSGDISMKNLNLPLEIYNQLVAEIQIVYHSAAEVNFLHTYSTLRNANVNGTKNIIDFCGTGKSKALHHISTIGVHMLTDDYYGDEEEVLSISSRATTKMGYCLSKWIAEVLVWKAIRLGLSAAIYRPGIIGYHSNSPNVLNSSDFYPRLIRTCWGLKSFPDLKDFSIPYGTVDFTSKTICRISLQNSNMWSTKVFNTYQMEAILNNLYELENVGIISKLPLNDWVRLAKTKKINTESIIVADILMLHFTEIEKGVLLFGKQPTIYNNIQTRQVLKQIDPALLTSESSLTKYIEVINKISFQ